MTSRKIDENKPRNLPIAGTPAFSADDVTRFLKFLGDNPDREGLAETPERFMRAWRFWCGGYFQDPSEVMKAFTDGAANYDEMIVQTNIPVFSMCEHHLAPFFGVCHIGYIPDGKVVGLSKLSRLVDVFSRRLQVQERLTTQIAESFSEIVQPRGVGVIIKCRHLCMESRGIQRMGAITTTSALLGKFRDEADTRAEFLAYAKEG